MISLPIPGPRLKTRLGRDSRPKPLKLEEKERVLEKSGSLLPNGRDFCKTNIEKGKFNAKSGNHEFPKGIGFKDEKPDDAHHSGSLGGLPFWAFSLLGSP